MHPEHNQVCGKFTQWLSSLPETDSSANACPGTQPVYTYDWRYLFGEQLPDQSEGDNNVSMRTFRIWGRVDVCFTAKITKGYCIMASKGIRTKRIFISDIHMGDQQNVEPPDEKEHLKGIAHAYQNREVIRRLRAIAACDEIDLIYVQGNHDMWTSTMTIPRWKEFLNELFPGINLTLSH